MKVLALDTLPQSDFYMSDICISELILEKEGFKTKDGRRLNGFLYVLEGCCSYTFNNDKIFLSPGCLMYLPKKSNHICNVISDELKYIRIDFNLINIPSGEELIFSTIPLLIKDEKSTRIDTLVLKLLDCRISPASKERLKLTALLYELLYTICVETASPEKSKVEKRIWAGIKFIEDTYTEKLNILKAAGLCNLSASRFRYLFREATGMSVLEYRENMRMEKALAMLKTNMYTVSEVAESLGYNTVYYFSNCFKKKFGQSPSNYNW